MKSQLHRAIDVAYAERTDLMVFALTGRTGSGCSTAAKVLCSKFDDIRLSEGDLSSIELRKLKMVRDISRSQWVPFKSISVSSVILSFALTSKLDALKRLLYSLHVAPEKMHAFEEAWKGAHQSQGAQIALKFIEGSASYASSAVAWNYFIEVIEPLAIQLRKALGSDFAKVFQKFGDNVRLSGDATNESVNPGRIFELMKRVRALVLWARDADRVKGIASTRVVIDAIRNPMELVYLRDQFAGLFVMAVTVDDDTRKQRLYKQGYSDPQIRALDAKEYGVEKPNKYFENYRSFISQSLLECMQKADVFIENPGRPEDLLATIQKLSAQLVRYVALMLRPGLVTPTQDERCMQVAFVAKLNSGCISRQVGAAISDESWAIVALGWNDVPKGQMPCLLRKVDSLLTGQSPEDFSDFEKTNAELRDRLATDFNRRGDLLEEGGLSCPFCFKSAFNKIKNDDNQVHTRSLHAEENAFLQLIRRGGTGATNGHLYTTASPCELCSKKAFQLGVKDIVYIDPYPGISSSHVLASGVHSARPKLRLFSGAVGAAYHRLYEPLMPIKDEFNARLGVDDDPQGELTFVGPLRH